MQNLKQNFGQKARPKEKTKLNLWYSTQGLKYTHKTSLGNILPALKRIEAFSLQCLNGIGLHR